MTTRANVVRLPGVSETSMDERISKYVEVWVTSGNKTEAYEAAGYASATPSNAYNFHKQHHEKITREAAMHLCGHVPLALKTLTDIMVNGKSETARTKCAIEVLDRAGLDKTTKIQIGNEEPKSQEDLQAQLKSLLMNSPELDILGDNGDDTD